jgi:hypothetical protein
MQGMQFVRHSAENAGTRICARRIKSEKPDSGTIKCNSFTFLGVFPFKSFNVALVT